MRSRTRSAVASATLLLAVFASVAQAMDPPPSAPFWQLRSWSLFKMLTGAPESATDDVATSSAASATAPAATAATARDPAAFSGLPESANWRAVSASENGEKLVVVAQGGAIYTSKDRGARWKASTTAPIAAGYVTVASSADGNKIVAGVNPGGRIWLSEDSGATFSAVPLPDGSDSSLPASAPWNAVAIDKSGTTIVAGEDPGKLWISNAFGAAKSWTTPQLASSDSDQCPPLAPYTSVVVSRDGQRISAASFRGTIYSSADAGKTFVAQKGAPDTALWQGLASSSDGTLLLAADQSPGSLWLSKDAGATFVAVGGAPVSAMWRHVASTYDGKTLAAVIQGGGIWRSNDAGESWSELGGGLPESANWHSIAVSSASGGSIMAAVAHGGKVWVSYDAGATWTSR